MEFSCKLSQSPLLRLDRGLINQHDGDVVLYRINPVTLGALETFRVLAVVQRLFARRTYQNFQQILGNHACIVRQEQ